MFKLFVKMSSKTEVTLEHFYIFNGTYAKKEGEASKLNLSIKYLHTKITKFLHTTYVQCKCVLVYFLHAGRKKDSLLLSRKRFRCSN